MNVAPVRYVALCRMCRRELEAVQSAERANATLKIELRCPKHGVLKRGTRYLMGFVPDEKTETENGKT